MRLHYSMLRLEFKSERSRNLQALWCISDKGAGFSAPLSTSAGTCSARGLHGKRRLSPPVCFSTLHSSAPELQNPWSSLDSEMERSMDQGERIYITYQLRIRFQGAISLPAQFRSSTMCFGSRQSFSSPGREAANQIKFRRVSFKKENYEQA
jgi:hypothetical protein